MDLNIFHNKDLSKYKILVTGGAGFIGSNLVEYLLTHNAGEIRILDNLSTGSIDNIKEFINRKNVLFIEGDIRNFETCSKATRDIDYVLHQAALGSVPRSIEDPITTNEVNISGFLNMLVASKDNQVKRFVYAASSSTYGDSKSLPKKEETIGNPLSPYAVTKYVNELYAKVFYDIYGLESIGLRYFNVFGPKQSPKGPYAAVIPLFIQSIINDSAAYINGDGEQTRDFTFVQNVVQANIKAMLTDNPKAVNQVYNIAVGDRTSLNELWTIINNIVKKDLKPNYRESRQGDVRDSLADISKANELLDYKPSIKIKEGLEKLINRK